MIDRLKSELTLVTIVVLLADGSATMLTGLSIHVCGGMRRLSRIGMMG